MERKADRIKVSSNNKPKIKRKFHGNQFSKKKIPLESSQASSTLPAPVLSNTEIEMNISISCVDTSVSHSKVAATPKKKT